MQRRGRAARLCRFLRDCSGLLQDDDFRLSQPAASRHRACAQCRRADQHRGFREGSAVGGAAGAARRQRRHRGAVSLRRGGFPQHDDGGGGGLSHGCCRASAASFTPAGKEEFATVELLGETEDQVGSGGPIHVRDMSMARLLVVSDVLAKSVVLAHDEREVAKMFETIEPFVRELASSGKFFRNRRGILRLIGEALLVQHNVSGRVAITDKPDALWDRPDLERLYARLEDGMS